jgi:hypothetical protein
MFVQKSSSHHGEGLFATRRLDRHVVIKQLQLAEVLHVEKSAEEHGELTELVRESAELNSWRTYVEKTYKNLSEAVLRNSFGFVQKEGERKVRL